MSLVGRKWCLVAKPRSPFGSVKKRVIEAFAPTKTARQISDELDIPIGQVCNALIRADLQQVRSNWGGRREGAGRKRLHG